MFLGELDGIGDVSRFLDRERKSITVLSGIYLHCMANDSVVVRDEDKLEGMGFMDKEMQTLEKMLAEQPPVPRTVTDMYSERIIGVTISSAHSLTERFLFKFLS